MMTDSPSLPPRCLLPRMSLIPADFDNDGGVTIEDVDIDDEKPVQPVHFDDEFEEFRARASSGGSLYGLLRRSSFLSASTSNTPLRKRKRSKSLIPTIDGDEADVSLTGRKQSFTTPDSKVENRLLHAGMANRSQRRFSTASVDARDVISKNNIRVSISPAPEHNTGSFIPSPEDLRRLEQLAKQHGGSMDNDSCDIEVGKLMPPDLQALINNMPDIPTFNSSRRRSFSITPKGVVHQGDEELGWSDYPMTPGSSQGSMIEQLQQLGLSRPRSGSLISADSGEPCSPISPLSPLSSVGDADVHRALLIGDHGVGKTALVLQFMTSEHMATHNISFDDTLGVTIPVILDGKESVMEFTDHCDFEEPGSWRAYPVEAYVVVYSVTDRLSFQHAVDFLQDLRSEELSIHDSAVILVGNKTDLLRNREVSDREGKSAARYYDCKYIEVSALINHKVDTLLVGVLQQIRLTNEQRGRSSKRRHKARGNFICAPESPSGCLSRPKKSLLSRFLRGSRRMAKSCENLFAL